MTAESCPGGIPELVSFAMSFSTGVFLAQGGLVEPVIIYQKGGVLYEPFLVPILQEVVELGRVREQVVESVRQFVLERGPEELVMVREGRFTGPGEAVRCLSAIYSVPSGERTWVKVLKEDHTSSWKEIKVQDGEFYSLFEKSTYRWN